VSVSVFEEKARALAGLSKGTEVDVEGRLSLNAWTGKDGQQRAGLAVTVWEVLPLARIGRKRRKKPRPEQTEAPPFDDDLSF
jgi:single-stranded DNA-binding protein